jgi:hypothetical protein
VFGIFQVHLVVNKRVDICAQYNNKEQHPSAHTMPMFQPDWTIRCFCNLKSQCADNDYCISQSVCMTKRVKAWDNPTKTSLKYYCGENPYNSVRAEIIRFRDCLLNTNNQAEYNSVIMEAEHCCYDSDMCNRSLNPNVSTLDSLPPDFVTAAGTASAAQPSNVIPIAWLYGIVLIASIVLIICLIVAIVGIRYLCKRRKDKYGNFKQNVNTPNACIFDDQLKPKSESYPFIMPPPPLSADSTSIRKKTFCFPIKKRLLFNKKLYAWSKNER